MPSRLKRKKRKVYAGQRLHALRKGPLTGKPEASPEPLSLTPGMLSTDRGLQGVWRWRAGEEEVRDQNAHGLLAGIDYSKGS
eukprot:1155105-Pelagomonas_calceolata.AAC.9